MYIYILCLFVWWIQNEFSFITFIFIILHLSLSLRLILSKELPSFSLQLYPIKLFRQSLYITWIHIYKTKTPSDAQYIHNQRIRIWIFLFHVKKSIEAKNKLVLNFLFLFLSIMKICSSIAIVCSTIFRIMNEWTRFT